MAIIKSFFTGYFLIIFLVGVPGNTLILAGYSKKSSKTGTDVLVMGLAAMDLTSSIFSVVKLVTGTQTTSYCQFKMYSTGWIALTQMMITLSIAIDRYFAVCRPMQRRPSVRKAVITFIFCNIFCLLFYIPAILATRYNDSVKDCLFLRELKWFEIYDRYVLQAFFIVCITIPTPMYFRVIFTLRRQVKIRATLVADPSVRRNSDSRLASQTLTTHVPITVAQRENVTDGGVDKSDIGTISGHRVKSDFNVNQTGGLHIARDPGLPSSSSSQCLEVNEQVVAMAPTTPTNPASTDDNQDTAVETTVIGQSEKRLTFILAIMTVIYILSWIPAIIGRCLSLKVRSEFMNRSRVAHTVYAMFFRLYDINSTVNIFLYWTMNKRFRQHCKDFFADLKRSVFKNE